MSNCITGCMLRISCAARNHLFGATPLLSASLLSIEVEADGSSVSDLAVFNAPWESVEPCEAKTVPASSAPA